MHCSRCVVVYRCSGVRISITATVLPEKSLIGAASAPPPGNSSPLLSANPRWRIVRTSRRSALRSVRGGRAFLTG